MYSLRTVYRKYVNVLLTLISLLEFCRVRNSPQALPYRVRRYIQRVSGLS